MDLRQACRCKAGMQRGNTAAKSIHHNVWRRTCLASLPLSTLIRQYDGVGEWRQVRLSTAGASSGAGSDAKSIIW